MFLATLIMKMLLPWLCLSTALVIWPVNTSITIKTFCSFGSFKFDLSPFTSGIINSLTIFKDSSVFEKCSGLVLRLSP